MSNGNVDFNWLYEPNSFDFKKNFDWRIDNTGRKAYARVWYDDASWTPLYEQMMKNFSVFDPVTRAQFVADNFALVR